MASWRRARTGIVAVVAAVSLALTGCQGSATVTVPVDAPDPIVVALPAVDPGAWEARGSVVTDDPLDVIDKVAEKASQARHVTYRSVSGITGLGTEVSGTFYLPKGTPPEGGWPVLGVAHGFTGITPDCAPSGRPDLHQYYGLIAALLEAGFAVAMTDYEGLGGPGAHPFLEPKTAGFNVIDSARAIRTLFPETADKWVAFGISQGGQASWSAAEMNVFYGGGTNLVGATAIAPAANMAGLAQLAYQEALTKDQRLIMPSFVVGAERSYPPVPVDRILRGPASGQDTALGCSKKSDEVRAALTDADLKPDTEADATVLETAARKMSLPTKPLTVPLFVMNGLADSVVPPQWVAQSVERACALGGQIEHHEVTGAGHDLGPDDQLAAWVTDRLAGKPASSNCAAR